MSTMDSVNQRTQLVGQNRLELLMFSLNGIQRFGINVFKVKEVLTCPKLTSLPKLNPFVAGVANVRGTTISVIDLSLAIGGRPTPATPESFIIISEYNRSVQGFLVREVDSIMNINWNSVMPPPKGSGRQAFLTAVTEIDGKLIEIIDVEKILNEITPVKTQISAELNENLKSKSTKYHIMVVDDSAVARRQIIKSLECFDLIVDTAKDGRDALQQLEAYAERVDKVYKEIPLIISDIEMPEMDGYTLTAEIRANPKLRNIKIILHTSLSGVFNKAMIQKIGADDFIAKFHPDDLAGAVDRHLHLSKVESNE